LMPKSFVRLSAGREIMNDEQQALCFFAGANSIFYGERLLTTDNPEASADERLFQRLGIHALAHEGVSDEAHTQALQQAVLQEQRKQLSHDAMSESAPESAAV